MPLNTQFVVVTTGSAGDLFPFLRLAAGLQARGHKVTLVAPELHAPMAARAGVPFHGTFADPAVLNHPDLWHPSRGFAIVWRAVQPGLAALPDFVANLPREDACVIVAHPLALPAADLCRATGRQIAIAVAYLAPSNIPTVHDPLMLGPLAVPGWVPHSVRRWLWRTIERRYIDPVVLLDINSARARAGMTPVDSLFAFLKHAPDLSLTLFPQWFGPRQPDWPSPLVSGEFPLFDPDPDAAFSPQLQAFLKQGSKPIVFTPGTANQQASKYFAAARFATERLGRRAIFLTPHRDQVPLPLPASILWQEYSPLQKLLPYAAALVHHGGIGTTAEACRAGVPQLVVPLAFDQFDNAARVVALGVGRSLPHARLSARALCRDLEQLLSSSCGLQADALSTHLSPPPSLDSLLDAISILISKTGKN